MIRVLIAVIFTLAVGSVSRAADPGGFRDLPWGAELERLADRGFEKIPLPKGIVSRVESYKRRDDDPKVGGATAEAITYNFLWGRLYSVAVDFTGYENLLRITDYCEGLFGKSNATMVKDMEYFVSFDSPGTGVLVYYQFAKHSFFVRTGRLFLFSKELDRRAM